MKVIIPRMDLVTLIGKIQNVVASKPTVPILANILLEAMNDELILSATDLSISVRAHTQAKVLEEGAITLPARRLFQLIRELTVPQVEIHATSPDSASRRLVFPCPLSPRITLIEGEREISAWE
jgi:DNA polymerase III subunit beta